MDKRQSSNLIDSIATILLGIGILLIIPNQIQIPAGVGVDSQVVSPRLFPEICAAAIILAGVFHLLSVLRKKEKSGAGSGKEINKGRLLLGVVVLFAYVALIPVLGFVLSSILDILCFVYLMARPNWYKGLALAVIATLIIWVGFYKFLHVPLPVGFLGI